MTKKGESLQVSMGNVLIKNIGGTMENLTNISVIKGILEKYNFTFSKALGQNFLVNPSVCPRMAEQGGAKEDVGVIEIGPGIGVLSHQLALRAKKVVCIEIDDRLIPILGETLSEHDNVKVLHSDVLKVDLHKLIEDEFAGMQVVICANLPYYITSPIIMALLERRLPVASITVMVQKEAAERLCAQPGTRECGAISAAIWYYSEAYELFDVSRGSFMPAPDVDSTVIRFDVRAQPAVEAKNERLFFSVIKGAFSQRRKTAANAVSAHLCRPKSQIVEAFERAGVSPSIRAEKMTLQNFADVTDNLGI